MPLLRIRLGAAEDVERCALLALDPGSAAKGACIAAIFSPPARPLSRSVSTAVLSGNGQADVKAFADVPVAPTAALVVLEDNPTLSSRRDPLACRPALGALDVAVLILAGGPALCNLVAEVHRTGPALGALKLEVGSTPVLGALNIAAGGAMLALLEVRLLAARHGVS